jgi:outer membrane protein assembly factor BamB
VRTREAATPAADSGNWLLWGGPTHDFKSPARNLASSWPASGPRRVWTRALGEGYSPIAVEGNRLYVMYSIPGRLWGAYDVVSAVAAETGQTLWENKDGAAFRSSSAELSSGPRAMPQVVGERVVTTDSAGHLFSLDKKTGEVVWSHDLYGEYGGSRMQFGYSCHPLPYKDSLIALLGGPRTR